MCGLGRVAVSEEAGGLPGVAGVRRQRRAQLMLTLLLPLVRQRVRRPPLPERLRARKGSRSCGGVAVHGL